MLFKNVIQIFKKFVCFVKNNFFVKCFKKYSQVSFIFIIIIIIYIHKKILNKNCVLH